MRSRSDPIRRMFGNTGNRDQRETFRQMLDDGEVDEWGRLTEEDA